MKIIKLYALGLLLISSFNVLGTTCNRDWDRYNKLKSETQHQMRKAQTDFIQNTVNRDIKENSKRFWSDIKSKRQEPTGVSPPFK